MIIFGLLSFASDLPTPGPAPSPVFVQPLHEGVRLGASAETLLLRGDPAFALSGQMGAPQLSLQAGWVHADARLQVSRLPFGPALDAAVAWHRAQQGVGGTDVALGLGVAALRSSETAINPGDGVAPYAELRAAHHFESGFSLPVSARVGTVWEPESSQSGAFAEVSVGAAWQTESCWEVGVGVVGSTTLETGDLRAQAGLSCRLDQLGG